MIKKSIVICLILLNSMIYAAGRPNGGQLAEWSPDGTKIAFLSSSPHLPKSLWIMDSNGTNAEEVIQRDMSRFVWSKSGTKIYFSTYKDGNPVWMEFNIQTRHNPLEINFLPIGANDPVWSSDDKWIAYTLASASYQNLWISSVDGQEKVQLTDEFFVRNPHWINQDKKIIYQMGQPYPNVITSIEISTKTTKMIQHGFTRSLSVSHNGKKIAYPESIGGGRFNLVIVNTDGSNKKEFILPGNSGSQVLWSPNDEQLLYTGRSGDLLNIWIINADGTNANQITPKEISAFNPQWSPDGKNVLFTGKSDKSFPYDIFTIRPDGSKLRPLTQSRFSQWAPAISPDGSKVAFLTNKNINPEIEICDRDGKTIMTIPDINLDFNSRLLWSKDGENLLLTTKILIEIYPLSNPSTKSYLRFPDGLYSGHINYQDGRLLVSANRSGGVHLLMAGLFDSTIKDLTEERNKKNPELLLQTIDIFPRWSPRGDRIAFVGNGDLCVMDSDGKNNKIIYATGSPKDSKDVYQAIGNPVWAPKGDKLVFTLAVNENNQLRKEIWIIDTEGSNPLKIYQEPAIGEFDLYESDYTYSPFFSPDGRYVYFTSDGDNDLPNIWRISVSGGEPEKITIDGGIFPAHMPEEDVLIYTSLKGNQERLFVLNLTGEKDALSFTK